jgi:hypothetical protein
MKILFIKNLFVKLLKLIRFIKIIIGVVFFFSLWFAIGFNLTPTLYKKDGIITNILDCTYTYLRGYTNNTYRIYIDDVAFTFISGDFIKSREDFIKSREKLGGKYAEIEYENKDIGIFRYEDFIWSLKIEGEVIYKREPNKDPWTKKSVIIAIISGILFSVNMYFDIKEKKRGVGASLAPICNRCVGKTLNNYE